jgi:general secretion pathway protein K
LNAPAQKQSGVALVIVLWILLLITISTSAFTLMARMDSLEAHSILWSTKARLAAEAGLNIAVLSLRDPDDQTRLIPDGRPFMVNYQDAVVEVMVTDERGKLNINLAGEQELLQLFSSNGLEEDQAYLLTDAILDWIDTDELTRPNGAEIEEYESAGYQVGPGNRNFVMVEELLQVIGLPWELYQKMQPGLTVWSEERTPNAAFAPVEALMALPDMDQETANEFVQERHAQESLDELSLTLPNGQAVVAQGRGLTYSIVAKATLPNGVWDQIEATIRLGGNEDGLPFRIMHWREGFHH